MKKEVELTKLLNHFPKYKIGPIRGSRVFIKLYLKNIKTFKFFYILKPSFVVSVIVLLMTSVVVHSYNSNNLVYGNITYPIKTNIEKIILLTKYNPEQKIKYYATLLDRRLLELEYLNNNINKEVSKFNIINEVYAENITTKEYTSSIAKTIKDIINLNKKIKEEVLEIKDEATKERLNIIIKDKELKQEVVFKKIQKNIIKNENTIKKDIYNEINNIINEINEEIEKDKNDDEEYLYDDEKIESQDKNNNNSDDNNMDKDVEKYKEDKYNDIIDIEDDRKNKNENEIENKGIDNHNDKENVNNPEKEAIKDDKGNEREEINKIKEKDNKENLKNVTDDNILDKNIDEDKDDEVKDERGVIKKSNENKQKNK